MNSDFLQTIVASRRQDVEAASQRVPFDTLQRAVASSTVMRRSLMDVLQKHWDTDRQTCIIAEVKKASPTAGLLRKDYHPATIGQEYERAGAVGISVLTEPRFFLGNDDDLRLVHNMTKLPVLRKDFICDPYQVYESAALGADVILLIAAALDFNLLRDLYIIALAIGLEVVVEVHTHEELEMVLPLARVILGVNSRNIRTLRTDLSVAKELAGFIPSDRICIAESGIKTRKDVEELQAVGFKGFLIGESLMKSANIGMCLRGLMGQPLRPA